MFIVVKDETSPKTMRSLSLRNVLEPFILNCWFGNDSSVLVSDIKPMSIFSFINSSTAANLFLKEYIFKWPIITFLGLFKVSKTTGLLCKPLQILPRLPLLTIYKSFTRPHVDYGDIICDHPYNVSFHQKLESIQ